MGLKRKPKDTAIAVTIKIKGYAKKTAKITVHIPTKMYLSPLNRFISYIFKFN